jgi:hypothetical protein
VNGREKRSWSTSCGSRRSLDAWVYRHIGPSRAWGWHAVVELQN